MPTDHPIGAKRLCLDTDYYETYNRDNVTLVCVKQTPIRRIDPDGVTVGDERLPGRRSFRPAASRVSLHLRP